MQVQEEQEMVNDEVEQHMDVEQVFLHIAKLD